LSIFLSRISDAPFLSGDTAYNEAQYHPDYYEGNCHHKQARTSAECYANKLLVASSGDCSVYILSYEVIASLINWHFFAPLLMK
jgi:hypothetical protein